MSRGSGKTLAGGQGSIQRGQAAAGVQQIGLLGDFSEQRVALLTAGGETGREKMASNPHERMNRCLNVTRLLVATVKVE